MLFFQKTSVEYLKIRTDVPHQNRYLQSGSPLQVNLRCYRGLSQIFHMESIEMDPRHVRPF